MSTFSVLMPAYNVERTIAPAIQSVLRQTRPDFELLIIDNGSSDGTVSRAKPFLGDHRVKLIHERTRGVASARNAGLSAAIGRYVSLLDGDDLWMPDYLEVMGATLDARPLAAVAYTDPWRLDDATRKIFRGSRLAAVRSRATPTGSGDFLLALLERGNFIFVSATVKHSALNDVGGFRTDLRTGEDYELWLRLAARGYGFVRCSRKLAIYRQRVGQLTADQVQIMRQTREVYRIVAEEYAASADVRAVARRRMREQEYELATFRPRRPRPVPHALKELRWFYVRPPREIRSVYPDLRRI